MNDKPETNKDLGFQITDHENQTFENIIKISSIEKNMIIYGNCTFEKEVTIQNSKIGYLSFVNCKFKDKFYIDLIDDNEIELIFFGDIVCEKEVEIRICKDSQFSIMNCEFINQCNISSNNRKIILTTYNCIFNKTLSLRNMIADRFSFEANKLNGNLIIDNFFIKETDIYSLRILKNSLLSNHNNVEALFYHNMEMELLFKNSTNYFERTLLFLNKISNNHGTSWIRGVLFTLMATLLFYITYNLSLKTRLFYFEWGNIEGFFQALDYHVKYISHFFGLTHNLDFMKDRLPYGYSYFIDLTSRIFIGYGIYQTVQAFRKYGKK